ncbi:hypothetical protein BN1222_03572 [Klebsiella quasipneumoniae]|nr:hypothetical protein BN1222_03572 [Klebsiella quasipneumoniae]
MKREFTVNEAGNVVSRVYDYELNVWIETECEFK